MNELIKPEEEQLYRRVTQILGDARGRVARTVNAEMVNAYWRIGREIVGVEQAGQARAGYADEVIVRLSARLTKRFGKSMGTRSLWRIPSKIRTTVLPEFQPPELPSLLSWSILTARYQRCLLTEAELVERLNRDRADAERALEKN